MVDYKRLLEEIRKYPGKTDEEIIAILNEPITKRRKVTTTEIMYEAYNIGLYTKLEAIALSDLQPVELRAFAKSLLSIAQNMPDLDTLSPAGETMLTALVQYQLITTEQADKFRNMGVVSSTSLAKKAGLGEPTVADIEAAREWQAAEDNRQPLRDKLEMAYYRAKEIIDADGSWADVVALFEAA